MSTPPLFALVMAGGQGTRFWPASRRSCPKQFLAIGSGEPLLAATVRRVADRVPPERTLVVTGAEHVELARSILPQLPPENVLGEPTGRNTLPCVALGAAAVRARTGGAPSVQVVLPADHVVAPLERFHQVLDAAHAAAAASPTSLFTFGVRPVSPATGFGYVEQGEALEPSAGEPVFRVRRFVEKPDLERARRFLEAGTYLWNSGMFVWSSSAVEAALERHAPATWHALRDADEATWRARYPNLEAVSIDVGVMERADDVRVLPVDFVWSDVGSWPSLPEVLPVDADQNCASGGARLVAVDSRRNVVHAEGGELVALVGVDDLVVVRAGGAILVCPRDRAQDVRAVVARLASEAPEAL